MSYEPLPDSVAGRAVTYLRSIYPQRVTSFELERAIGAPHRAGLHASLRYALDAGVICVERRSPRRVVWWASGPLVEEDDFGPPLEQGFGTDAPGRELAEVWGRWA